MVNKVTNNNNKESKCNTLRQLYKEKYQNFNLNSLIEETIPNYYTKGNYLHNTKYSKCGKIINKGRVLVKD